MQANEIHETIASQIHHMKPAHLEPGKHIGMAPVDDETLLILVAPTATLAVVRYERGQDLYSVVVNRFGHEVRDYDGVFCDQLGDLIFGVDGERWTMPFGAVITENPDGTLEVKEF